jgi:hypothetical protein
VTDPRRVRLCQLLLAKAARTNFPAEAEACRQKANKLMAKYGIAAADVAPPPPPISIRPPVAHWGNVVIVITTMGTGSGTGSTTYGQQMWW